MPVNNLQVELGRRYRFSASHRLHTAKLSDEQNREVFGKCNNPYGHGHNYILEIKVSGEIDPETGLIANLVDLDAFVEARVLQVMDHKSLNDDVAVFAEKIPTTENLCVEIYNRLKSFRTAKIASVRIEETRNNSFEYAGEGEPN